MLPLFPETRKLLLSDRDDIERITKQFPPYSDFNFVSLWSWNTESQVQVSQLCGNLVLYFPDYLTREMFFTFVGRTSVNETVHALLWQCQREGIAPVLKLIPKCCADGLDASFYSVTDDLDQTDYIVSTAAIAAYQGRDLRLHRNFVRRFTEHHQSLKFRRIDLASCEIKAQIRSLFGVWHSQKTRETTPEQDHEYFAIMRCIETFPTKVIATGLFLDDTLVAFWLGEDVGNQFGISHFEKAETTTYTGIVPYLRQRTAQLLLELGIEHINLEQDLGIAGLRQSKRSYAPVAHLHKYRVSR